jgi:hypothetical protein
MLIVMKISIAVTYMRFGMDVLEDHFIADLSTKYSSSAEFMSFYGLLNFYIYTMVFVYSPSSSATLQSSCKSYFSTYLPIFCILYYILVLGQRLNLLEWHFVPNMHTIEIIDVIIRYIQNCKESAVRRSSRSLLRKDWMGWYDTEWQWKWLRENRLGS